MTLSPKAKKIYDAVSPQGTKLGDMRKIAAEIKKDHAMANELWSTANLSARLLAILIMDKKELTAAFIDTLLKDIKQHDMDECLQLADSLLANQLMKDKKTIALLESWATHSSALHRRLFWYYQGRLRWVGQTPAGNTKELLTCIEKNLANEEPEVQWAMNFTAAWIGIFDKSQRDHCVKMGEKIGLYKDEIVAKGCHPNYLPAFIAGEVKKRKL